MDENIIHESVAEEIRFSVFERELKSQSETLLLPWVLEIEIDIPMANA